MSFLPDGVRKEEIIFKTEGKGYKVTKEEKIIEQIIKYLENKRLTGHAFRRRIHNLLEEEEYEID